MKRIRVVCAAALLAANAATAYAQFGPCNITVAAGFVNTIVCTGSIIPPGAPPGCAGAATTIIQQKACANADSTPCTNLVINRLIVSPAVLVGTWIVGPCYGVTGPPTPGVWSYNCLPGPAFVVPGGTSC